MEVSLHRTKSLLGEKIIRLRHLEQSLERAGDRASGAATLSDVSSHSGSSGFSSSATPEAAPWRSLRAAHYHEPTEIVHSLESLNTEIRDIWQVLHRRRKDAGEHRRRQLLSKVLSNSIKLSVLPPGPFPLQHLYP